MSFRKAPVKLSPLKVLFCAIHIDCYRTLRLAADGGHLPAG